MTDFLTSLLERSRGLDRGLMPRLPSVFEPPPGNSPAPGDSPAPGNSQPPGNQPHPPIRAPQPPGQDAQPPARVPQPPARVPQPPDDASPAPKQPRPDSMIMSSFGQYLSRTAHDHEAQPMARQAVVREPGRTAGEPAIPQAETVAPRAATVSETELELLAGIALPHAGPAGRPPRSAVPQALAVREAPAVPAVPEALAVPAVPEALAVPAVPREHTARQQDSASQASASRQPRGEPHPPGERLPVGEPQSPPRLGTLAAPPQLGFFAAPRPPAPVPPPEPTVHVTIGRVEIRAVTAPAPSARREQREQAARTMSLDEYLAERNQRRRA